MGSRPFPDSREEDQRIGEVVGLAGPIFISLRLIVIVIAISDYHVRNWRTAFLRVKGRATGTLNETRR